MSVQSKEGAGPGHPALLRRVSRGRVLCWAPSTVFLDRASVVGQERAVGLIHSYFSRASGSMKCGTDENPVRKTLCSRACVLSHW